MIALCKYATPPPANYCKLSAAMVDDGLSMRLSQDARLALHRLFDGTVRIWDIATGDELAAVIPLDGGDWLVTTPEGLFDGSPEGPRERGLMRRQRAQRRAGRSLLPGLLPPRPTSASIWKGERPVPESGVGRTKAAFHQDYLLQRRAAKRQGWRSLSRRRSTDEGGGISGPWLVHNGMRIRTRIQVVQMKNSTNWFGLYSLLLAPGENRHGSPSCLRRRFVGARATISLKYAETRRERSSCMSVPSGSIHSAESSLNLKYRRPWTPRRWPGFFEKPRQAIYSAEPSTHPFPGRCRRHAGQHSARRSQGDRSRPSPKPSAIVFLAGHGTAIGQRYYYVTHEFKRSDAATVDEDIRKQALAGDVLASWLEDIHATKRIIDIRHPPIQRGPRIEREPRNPFAFQGGAISVLATFQRKLHTSCRPPRPGKKRERSRNSDMAC